jgi:ATP-dependent Clp protease ATP-binding subunit ClpA
MNSFVSNLAHLAQDFGGKRLTVTREAMEFLLREGYDARFGARPMRRAVERHVQDAVVRDLFASGVGSGRVNLAVTRSGLQVTHD